MLCARERVRPNWVDRHMVSSGELPREELPNYNQLYSTNAYKMDQ